MTDLTAVSTPDLTAALRSRGHVVVLWSPEDVEEISDLKGEEAADWLFDNGHRLEDRSIELGWEVLDVLLQMDGHKSNALASDEGEG